MWYCKSITDVFIDNKKIVKSHLPTANTLVRIEIPKEQKINIAVNESKPRLKHGRHVGGKDKIPRRRKLQENQVAVLEETIPIKQATERIDLSQIHEQKSPKSESSKRDPSEAESSEGLFFEDDQLPENNEISIHYVYTGDIWNRYKIVVDNIFSFKVALDMSGSNDHEMEP